MNYTATIQSANESLVSALLQANTNNRNLRKSVVAKYKHDIENGNWQFTNQGIGVYEDGTLADGQHRLTAIYESKAWGLPLLIVRGLKPEALLAIDQGAKRTIRDALSMIWDLSMDSRTVPILNVLFQDQNNWDTYIRPTPNQVKDLLEDWHSYIDTVLKLPMQNKTFYSAPQLAAIVYALRDHDNFEKIQQFMTEVNENGISQTTKSFYTWVMTQKGSSGGSILQKERFFKSLNAIYAYVRDSQLSKIYARDPR